MHTYVRARVVEKRYVASIVIAPKIKVGDRGKAENSCAFKKECGVPRKEAKFNARAHLAVNLYEC